MTLATPKQRRRHRDEHLLARVVDGAQALSTPLAGAVAGLLIGCVHVIVGSVSPALPVVLAWATMMGLAGSVSRVRERRHRPPFAERVWTTLERAIAAVAAWDDTAGTGSPLPAIFGANRRFEHPEDRVLGIKLDPKELIQVIVTGVILILLAFLFDIGLLYTIGAVLVVVGAILWILGAVGRAVGPRTHYW